MKKQNPSNMSRTSGSGWSRRDAIKTDGAAVAATTLGQLSLPSVHASEENTIRLALIGSGNRGSDAVANAIASSGEKPIKLYAMADILEHRLKRSHQGLSKNFGDKIDVPPERQFIGLDLTHIAKRSIARAPATLPC